MEPPVDPLLGRLIAGKLEILRLLGAGAMGRVYRAHHVGLDKPVAIKVLLNPGGSTTAQSLRFQAEARAASRLDHPNSVQVLDFGQDRDGLLYIAMEYLEGVDLQAVLGAEERLPGPRAAFIMSQVFAALGAAHQKGVVHRDMKPGNVMLIEKIADEGRIQDFVKVCDFGLAKILDGEGNQPPLTRQGAIFGTPAYMSPEQARGAPLDGRSDIYACGVILYKVLSGRTPFRADSPTAVLLQHLQEPPPPLGPLVPSLDPRLEAIVLRCLEKDPNDRFQDAREARDALREVLRSQGLDLPSVTGVASAIAAPLRGPSPTARPLPGRPVDPTESMRPPLELPPDQLATAVAMPAPRVASHVATVAADTVLPATVLPRPSAPAPSSAPSAPAAPAPSMAPGPSGGASLAAIPGIVALVALGALVAFVVLRDPRPQNAAPAIVVDASVVPTGVAPPPSPAPAPIGPSDARSGAAIEPSDPNGEAGRVAMVKVLPKDPSSDGPETIRKRTPRPTAVNAEPERAAPEPSAPAAPAPRPADTGAIAGPAAPPAAPTPAPEPALAVHLEGVKVQGGVSKRRSEESLARGREAAARCVLDAARAQGSRAGRVTVTANVDERGRLTALSAVGDLAIQPCLREALGMVKLPVPDTGTGRIEFVLSYGPDQGR